MATLACNDLLDFLVYPLPNSATYISANITGYLSPSE